MPGHENDRLIAHGGKRPYHPDTGLTGLHNQTASTAIMNEWLLSGISEVRLNGGNVGGRYTDHPALGRHIGLGRMRHTGQASAHERMPKIERRPVILDRNPTSSPAYRMRRSNSATRSGGGSGASAKTNAARR